MPRRGLGRRAKSGRRALLGYKYQPYKLRRGIYRYGGYKGMGSIYGSTPKFNDVTDTLTVTAANATGADKLDNISAIDIGTGPTDRNAQCVALTSIYLRFTMNVPQFNDPTMTTAEASPIGRAWGWKVLLILDRQPNKAALSAADIWELVTDWNTPLNLDNRKRIKILKVIHGRFDGSQYMQFSNTSAGVNEVLRASVEQNRKYYMKFKKPLKVEYDTGATTGVIGDIVDNAISVWFVSQEYQVNQIEPLVKLYARTRFVSC